MGKLFAYKHEGEGGCGKTAFYTLSRPKDGESLADTVVIGVDGTRLNANTVIMCGHCHNGVLGLKIKNLKLAKFNEVVAILINAVNNHTIQTAEVDVVTEKLQLLHECCSKVHPKDLPNFYQGSALEASIKEVLGDTSIGIITGCG